MREFEHLITLTLGLFVGALMAFGLVLLFVFFGSSDTCRAALYSLVSFLQ